MKRVVMLLLSINTVVFVFAQGINIVHILWGTYKKPKMLELNYVSNNDIIEIPCDSDTVIVIHREENRRQLIEVIKAGKIQYSFFPKYIIDPFYLWAVYRYNRRVYYPQRVFELLADIPSYLLCFPADEMKYAPEYIMPHPFQRVTKC
ncbi:MAG: hypothetical protein LBC31_08905 [Treponema sp.]|jgi:hypothetical protein|nr:hypothetical protein [Treponema sp.]